MLEHKVILYDDSCPMCKAYTQGFVQMGILTAEHRVGLAHAAPNYTTHLDLNRARHEIPLLDTQTGEVTYGMDALFTLIGYRFPVFMPLFRLPRFRALVYGLYQIVTYNRRVIAGCAPPRDGFNCAPDFNRPVRLRYLRIALSAWIILLSGATLAALLSRQTALAAALIGGGTIQAFRLNRTRRTRCAWDKAGGLATNNLLFGLLLTPSLLPLPPAARWLNFALAATVALVDAARRQQNCKQCTCGAKAARYCRQANNKKAHWDR